MQIITNRYIWYFRSANWTVRSMTYEESCEYWQISIGLYSEPTRFTLGLFLFSASNQLWRKSPNTKTNSPSSKRKRRSSTSETSWKLWRKRSSPWKKKTKRYVYNHTVELLDQIEFFDHAYLFSIFIEETRLVQKGRRKEGKRRRSGGIRPRTEFIIVLHAMSCIFLPSFIYFHLLYVHSTPACHCY